MIKIILRYTNILFIIIVLAGCASTPLPHKNPNVTYDPKDKQEWIFYNNYTNEKNSYYYQNICSHVGPRGCVFQDLDTENMIGKRFYVDRNMSRSAISNNVNEFWVPGVESALVMEDSEVVYNRMGDRHFSQPNLNDLAQNTSYFPLNEYKKRWIKKDYTIHSNLDYSVVGKMMLNDIESPFDSNQLSDIYYLNNGVRLSSERMDLINQFIRLHDLELTENLDPVIDFIDGYSRTYTETAGLGNYSAHRVSTERRLSRMRLDSALNEEMSDVERRETTRIASVERINKEVDFLKSFIKTDLSENEITKLNEIISNYNFKIETGGRYFPEGNHTWPAAISFEEWPLNDRRTGERFRHNLSLRLVLDEDGAVTPFYSIGIHHHSLFTINKYEIVADSDVLEVFGTRNRNVFGSMFSYTVIRSADQKLIKHFRRGIDSEEIFVRYYIGTNNYNRFSVSDYHIEGIRGVLELYDFFGELE